MFKARAAMLIITHRLETVKSVDNIIWIDGGKVQGSGAPAELMARSPRLASIFGSRQSDTVSAA